MGFLNVKVYVVHSPIIKFILSGFVDIQGNENSKF